MKASRNPQSSQQDIESERVRTILVANLDTVKAKNLYQFKALATHGCRFVVLTTDSLADSKQVGATADNVEVVSADAGRVRRSMIGSLMQLLRIRHFELAELYPSSHLSLVMAVLIKLRGIPLVIVARGAEYYYLTGQMSRTAAMSFRMAYRLANHVIYKETYMSKMLARFGKRSTWLLPNAVSIPDRVHEHRRGRCHLLYLNSMKDFRHPEVPLQAFLAIAAELKLTADSDIRLLIVGFQDGATSDPVIIRKESKLREMVCGMDVPVDLHPWIREPGAWLDDADVFLLPADVVFLNYSLLEAMSRGVPAIVQETDSSDRIISHGENGYILPLEVESWRQHMLRLIQDAQLRANLGVCARARVIDKYSLDTYARRYSEIYDEILGRIPISDESVRR